MPRERSPASRSAAVAVRRSPRSSTRKAAKEVTKETPSRSSPRSRSPARSASPKKAANKTQKTEAAKKKPFRGEEAKHSWPVHTFRTTLVPLFLILGSPIFTVSLVSNLHGKYGGNLESLLQAAAGETASKATGLSLWLSTVTSPAKIYSVLALAVEDLPRPSWDALEIVLVWAAFQIALLYLLDGEKSRGPATGGGFRPTYRLNGVPAFLITQFSVVLAWHAGLFSAAHVVSIFGDVIATLSFVSIFVILALLVKGKFWPTHRDSDSEFYGNIVWDFWHGVELYPALFGLSLKQIVNCRISMNAWVALPIVFALAQAEIYGEISYNLVVSAALVGIYMFKFFLWEDGYFNSIDIIHDRFGFYICWGCLVWVPSVYTSFAWYMLHHRSAGSFKPWGSPAQLVPNPALGGMQMSMMPAFQASEDSDASSFLGGYTFSVAVANFVAGAVAVFLNYWSDLQRQQFRSSGKVFGVKSPRFVTARYRLDDGVERRNRMLVSGWWGMARHINYVWELTAAFLWTCPAGFDNFLPYFYFAFLTILLVDRQYRDELRMRKKYGGDWDKVCKLVPTRILPGIY
jgi:7-dehydrocholesterol reductase